MTIDEAIKRFSDNAEYERSHGSLQGCLEFRQLAEWLAELKELKEQTESCEDCVSRQRVLDIVEFNRNSYDGNDAVVWIEREIKELPSVQPEPKTGRWEYVQYDGNPKIGNWHCSECNRIVCGIIRAGNPVYAYKYCPECGAKMESEGKE